MTEIGNVTFRVDAVIADKQYHEAMSAVGAANERMAELQAENAKLRELCRDLRKEYAYLRARPRRFYVQHEARMAAIDDRMRELGIDA